MADEARATAEVMALPPRRRGPGRIPDGMPELPNDPRFARLCARLGLVQFWSEAGRWPDCVDQVPYGFKADCEKVRHVPIESLGF